MIVRTMRIKIKRCLFNSRYYFVGFIGFIVLLFLINFVSAVAVSGPYSESRILEIYPGQSISFKLVLQNAAGDPKDVKFSAKITEGSEYVSLLDENTEYFVPAGTADTVVNVGVKVPKNSEIGSEYIARIEFEPLPVEGQETGMISILTGISRSFKIKVSDDESLLAEEKPKEILGKEASRRIFWMAVLTLIIAVVLIAVIVFITKKREARKVNKNSLISRTMPDSGSFV